MSETTPGETPVERRLREMVEAIAASRRGELRDEVILTPAYEQAIDASREALALLRRVRALRGMRESAWVKWAQETDALLARCEGDR